MTIVGKVLVDLIGYTRVSPAVKSIACQLAVDIIAITDSDTVTSVVIPVLEKYKADINPEELAIHIALRAKHRSISKPFLSTRWKHKDPLHVDNLDRIGKVSFVMRHARPVDQRCGERHDIGGTVEFGRHPDTVAG